MLIDLLRRGLRAYRPYLAAIVAFQLTATCAALYLPSINAEIIDKGVATGDTGTILRLGSLMLAISLLQVICTVIAVYFAARTAMGFGRDLRREVFHHVGDFSQRELQQFGAPSLITRGTNDVQQVQMLVMMGCTLVVTIPIMMIGGVLMAMREDFGLSWIFAVVVPVLLVVVSLVIRQMLPASRLQQSRVDEVNRVLREQITGVRVVRAFVREPHETERFAAANTDLTAVATTVGRWQAVLFPAVMLVVQVAGAAVLWFGGHRVASGDMEVGALTAFLSYLMQILMSVMMGTFMFMLVPRASVSADRISEVLATTSSVPPPADPLDPHGHGLLDFEQVDFAYPGAEHPVLRGVSFSATPGRTIAIVGSTGAGKSTLVNLVPRLFDTTAGTVRVDGVDVRRLDPEVLWSKLGLVPQQAYLFTGTVGSNVRYGRPGASDEEVWHALEVAQAADFVRALPEGLDAAVVQGGTNFSGGQRQRLAIARALVRRPEIYLFDDSFSALDVATDARLRAALAPETAEATVLIVAQRIATVRDADLILVMEDGVVVARGSHADLLASDPTYQEICASQASEEVAA